jgi:alpha-1,2-mannosyltransferase
MGIRWWIFAALCLWLTPVLSVGAGGLGLAPGFAIAAGIAVALLVALPASRALMHSLGGDQPFPLAFRLALAAAAAVAILQMGSLSIFMADVTRTRFSIDPDDPFRRVHSCASAYAEAVRFLRGGGHNIYERSLYRPPGAPREIGPLRVDPYHYPPPFLLLPQAVGLLTLDFWDFRRLWFMLQALMLGGAIAGLAAWVGGRAGTFALLGGVILLALPHPVATLQQGNFQITGVPLAICGFVLLVAGRAPAGGAVLAYAALAKIFPGILLIPLVTGRRWRQLVWLVAMGIAVVALTFVVQGLQPARDFASTSLPELSSGAAFPQTEMAPHSRVNWSAYGQTVRLRQLGVTWLTQSRGLMVAQIYGVLVVALAAWAGWRGRFDLAHPGGRIDLVIVGLALVGLASYRSPFVGAVYASLSTLWTMTLLAARGSSPVRSVCWLGGLVALGWAIWLVPSPAAPASQPWVWISGMLVLACMAVNVWAIVTVVWQAPQRVGAPTLTPAAVIRRSGKEAVSNSSHLAR